MLNAKPGHRVAAVLHPFVRTLLRSVALLAVSASATSALEASAPEGPTVTDVVEFTRIVQPRNGDADQLRAQISPDRTRAFIVTRKANTRTDRNRYEILLLDVRPEHLSSGQGAAPQSVLALDPLVDDNSAMPALQDARWSDDRTIVFRARIADALFQVYRVDTTTHRIAQLTFSPTGVMSYAVSDDLHRVVYTAQQPNPPLAPGKHSIVVGNQSFWSVKFGQQDMRSQLRRYQFFVSVSGSRQAAKSLGPSFAEAGTGNPAVSISPDGRWAIVPRYEPERHLAWIKDYPLVAEASARVGPAMEMDRPSYFVRPDRYVPRRFVAYRLPEGREQAILDAPDDTSEGYTQTRSDRLWQAGSRSVIIAGTHLPRPAGKAAPRSSASHIVEYWPETGRWAVIAELKGRLQSARWLTAAKDSFVTIDGNDGRYFKRRADGTWQEVEGSGKEVEDALVGVPAERRWTLRVGEELNVPPDIVAEGPAGQMVRLTTLNAQVSASWGTMRPYAWKDAKGRAWDGGLMVPAGFDPRARHALVIQTYGFSPTRFYLDGSNMVDGFTSGFAGRAFLRENIVVLGFPLRASTDAPTTEAGALAAAMEGVRGAIDALVGEGLVDRDRIGIMGWSMTGERVLNQVTFSDAPIRAASIMDGDANTMFSLAVTYAASDNQQLRKAETNGGLPYGEGLATWVRNDPAMHTDCVKAALRIETYGPWVLNNWDIYALLRRQYKAAEMVVIPGGSHGLMTPSERMLSLQGNVDWYKFWLNGEERKEPLLLGETEDAMQDQYRRWHQMAEFKRVDDAKPDCARKAGGN